MVFHVSEFHTWKFDVMFLNLYILIDSVMSFSNRCFPSKAIAMWLQADDIGRLTIVGSYYHYSAKWTSIEALDIKDTLSTPQRPTVGDLMKNPALGLAWMNAASVVAKNNQGDPMLVVKGVK